MKRLQLLAGVMLGLVLLAAGCSGDSDNDRADVSVSRIALVMTGSSNDGGWNQEAHEGLVALRLRGFETAFSDGVPLADIRSTVERYALNAYDLVIGHGIEFSTPVLDLAPKHPNTNFFVTAFAPDPSVELPPNLTFIDAQFYQDQTQAAPDLMLTSFRMELAEMVEHLGKDVHSDRFPAGVEWAPSTDFMWTFTFGGDDYNAKRISADTWAEFESLFTHVNSGAICVPTR